MSDTQFGQCQMELQPSCSSRSQILVKGFPAKRVPLRGSDYAYGKESICHQGGTLS